MEATKANLERKISYAKFSIVYDLQKKADRDDRNEILDWLCPWDYESRHRDLLKEVEHGPRAGSWLLDSRPFQDWRHNRLSKLWYTGKRKSASTRYLPLQ